VNADASTAIEICAVNDSPTRDAARPLIVEYLHWIATNAASQFGLSIDVDAMVDSDLNDRTKFYPPSGRFYIVRHRDNFGGVACLKSLAPKIGELQRMYIQQHVRGVGAGRRLLTQLLADARAIGHERVRLESLRFCTSAHALYRSVGFVEVPPYDGN